MTAIEATPPGTSNNPTAFRLERDGEGAVLWFDLPGEKVNKFTSWVMAELDEQLDEIAATEGLTRLVIISGKPSTFIAGADIEEFTRVTSAEEAERFTLHGQSVMTKVSRLPQITVAAINGACMGGGTELALSCDYRIASDNPKTTIALPETQLGIIPAFGGTTRLPRLVGIPAALDMILTGKSLDGRRARAIGLVDEVVPASILLSAAKEFAAKRTRKRKGSSRTHFYVEGNPLSRMIIFRKARASVMEKTGGKYPAPLAAIDVMALGFRKGAQQGFAAEALEAGKLVTGEIAQNLIRIFFLREASKKDRSTALPRPVVTSGVLGAGVMGGAIAQIISDKAEIDVRMKDVKWDALGGGLRAASKLWKKQLDRRRITRNEMGRRLARITTTVDWSGFDRVDLVVEAVVENLNVKQSVLAEFEGVSKPDAIFATNTSTIPISLIAEKAARPQNVVGMHFFNPVDRMPLVEVIRGKKSSDASVATVAAFARKLGKTVVHCNDAPGFVVNRVLAPYMNEAALMLEEGHPIETIDKAMLDFGMPMGPLALLDEVGIDVAAKAGAIMAEAFPDRMIAAQSIHKILLDERLGKKNGRGVYLWVDGKRGGVDPAIYRLVGAKHRSDGQLVQLAERMVLAMVGEASRILDAKVVGSAGELDLAMIMGTGFPPFRGGLARFADSLGIPYVVARLDDLESKCGPRFTPSPILRQMAEKGTNFYSTFPRKGFAI